MRYISQPTHNLIHPHNALNQSIYPHNLPESIEKLGSQRAGSLLLFITQPHLHKRTGLQPPPTAHSALVTD